MHRGGSRGLLQTVGRAHPNGTSSLTRPARMARDAAGGRRMPLTPVRIESIEKLTRFRPDKDGGRFTYQPGNEELAELCAWARKGMLFDEVVRVLLTSDGGPTDAERMRAAQKIATDW